MRLFCAIEVEPYPGNRLWQNNIVDALKDLGHEVIPFQFPIDEYYKHAEKTPADLQWVSTHRPTLEKALLEQIRAEHQRQPIQAFFSYFYSAHCTAATIREIRALGLKTMNWYCNASYQLNLVSDLAPAYDLCLVPEKQRLDDYRQLGAKPFYSQEAANPGFYKDLNLPRDLGLVFFGHNYATRAQHLAALLENQLPVDVWGRGWTWAGNSFSWDRVRHVAKRLVHRLQGRAGPQLPRNPCHGFTTDREMVNIYNRAKIALGFGVVGSQAGATVPTYQVRLRDFEAPMCGTFYLTEHQPELAEFFELGKEIETFNSQVELLDKARFYLRHDEARDKIRFAGHARCVRDHTWQIRLRHALQALTS